MIKMINTLIQLMICMEIMFQMMMNIEDLDLNKEKDEFEK